jgi:hypothetical protein
MENTKKKKYTIEQTYVKTDVWFGVEASSEEEAYKKIMGKTPDDERYGIDTETEYTEEQD